VGNKGGRLVSNLDIVNHFAILLFETLYPEFPKRSAVNLSSLDPDADAKRLRLYRDAMMYLRDKELITFEMFSDSAPHSFYGVVLTDKGRELWKSANRKEPEKRRIGFQLPHDG
jgi:hypothetical protein